MIMPGRSRVSNARDTAWDRLEDFFNARDFPYLYLLRLRYEPELFGIEVKLEQCAT